MIAKNLEASIVKPPQQRSSRRLLVLVGALALLALVFAALCFSYEILTKNAVGFNAVGGGKYGYTFWYFSNSDGNFLFAIGDENTGQRPLSPGFQGLLSNDYLYFPFHVRYGQKNMRVVYDSDSDSVEIDARKFDRKLGNVLIFREGKFNASDMEQHLVVIDQEKFQEKGPLGGFYLLGEIDKTIPPPKNR